MSVLEQLEMRTGRNWHLCRRYRKGWLLWHGDVYANADWVSMHLDGVGSRMLWSGVALSERGIRHRLARQLWRMSRDNPERWIYDKRAA